MTKKNSTKVGVKKKVYMLVITKKKMTTTGTVINSEPAIIMPIEPPALTFNPPAAAPA